MYTNGELWPEPVPWTAVSLTRAGNLSRAFWTGFHEAGMGIPARVGNPPSVAGFSISRDSLQERFECERAASLPLETQQSSQPSSDEVLHEAEAVIANLLKWYGNPILEVRVLMEQAARHEVSDPIQMFTQACRRERGEVLRHL